MAEEITIAPTGDKLTILKADASKPIHEESVSYTGNLAAANDYLLKKTFDPQEGIIQIDTEEPSIKLIVGHRHSNRVTVTGIAKINENIDLYGINEDQKFDLKTILKQVRLTRFLFANDEDFTAVKNRLMNFSVKSKNDVSVSQQQGSNGHTAAIDKSVEWADLAFIMKLPLFSNAEPVTFRVNVCCEVTSATPMIYFESEELPTLLQTAKEDIVKSERKKLETFGISIITE